jgi:hypothetical protein
LRLCGSLTIIVGTIFGHRGKLLPAGLAPGLRMALSCDRKVLLSKETLSAGLVVTTLRTYL